MSAPAVLEFPTGMSEIEALKILRAGQDPMDTVRRGTARKRGPRMSYEIWNEDLLGRNMQAFAEMLTIWRD
jgi:hypothetical protein